MTAETQKELRAELGHYTLSLSLILSLSLKHHPITIIMTMSWREIERKSFLSILLLLLLKITWEF